MTAALGLVSTAISQAACGFDGPQRVPEALLGNAFVSVAAQKDGEPLTLAPRTRIELSFREPGYVGWEAGCNSRASKFQITEDDIRIDDRFESTLMGCPGELSGQEQWVTRFLTSDPNWLLDEGLLVLWSGGTAVVLREVPGIVF